MFCTECGNQLADNDKFCPACGTIVQGQQDAEPAAEPAAAESTTANSAASEQPVVNVYQNVYTSESAALEFPYDRSENSGLLLAAFVFNLIGLIAIGWLILPLCWTIPMTVHSWRIYKGQQPNTVCFGVCTLLFLSLIGGVLMLVASKDK